MATQYSYGKEERMRDEKKKEAKARMVLILKSHGIEMDVGGCGCCNSPWVKFKYNGETILDTDNACFDTGETPNDDAATTG